MVEVDPKRTGVKAVLLPHFSEPKCELLPVFDEKGKPLGDRWYAAPGSMIPVVGGGTAGFNIACPGCGQIGCAREGQAWTVVGGNRDDVTTLSLSPSIAKSCCGWHGYLKNGVFESC